MAAISFTEGTDNITSRIRKETSSNIDTLELTVPDSATISVNDTVSYYDATPTLLFKGIVQNLKTGDGVKVATIYDLGSELLQRNVNTIYNSQSPEAIIQSVLTNFAPSLTYSSTIVSGLTIDSYVAKNKRAWDVVTEMAEILLASFRVDNAGLFILEQTGASPSTKNITTDNAVLKGKWEQDISQQVNSITIEGEDRQSFEADPELFSGTGSQTEFVLSEVPIDVKVEHPVGTIKTGYVRGSGSGDYYVDRDNKKIVFDTAPASGTNNIQVSYNYSIPIAVRRRDATSISAYGQKDKIIRRNYIKTRDEARQLCEFILDRFSEPTLSSVWTIANLSDYNDFNNWVPNNTIIVDDELRNISGTFLINKVVREYPGNLMITVGQETDDVLFWQREAQQRIKQLEEKDDNSSILNEDELVVENINVTYSLAVTSAIKRTYDADTWYWQETGGTRNDWREDGSGDVFRESTGFTDDNLFIEYLILESGDYILQEDGTSRIIED